MANNSVHIKEAILIKPCEPTPTHILPLSALDSQLFLRFTIEYIFVYKNNNKSNHSNLVEQQQRQSVTSSCIKSALSKILVPYYPLAGRVRAKPDGSGLEVVCGGQGAVFVEATCAGQTVRDFDSAPKYVDQWRKLLSLHVADVLKGAPPLVLQLTWLKDGAATLCVGINHCVCDGVGSAELLNSLAELAESSQARLADIKPEPIWARHLFGPLKSNIQYNLLNHPEFSRVPDLCGGFLTRFLKEKLTPTSIIFDKMFLNSLKRHSMTTNWSNQLMHFTSFEVLSAHIWRSWATALNFLPSNQTLKLLFSINIRNRVKPSVPSGYYGNAFVLGCAQASVEELREKSLGNVAMLIRRAKERVDNEHVMSVVDSLGRLKACPDSVGVLIISQWSSLGLERVDFGMGEPVHIGPVCCDRYCLFLPVHNQTGSVKVMLAVPTSGTEKYLQLVKCTPLS